jgi:two-component system, chemotaxis family, sensor kinase Cph1
VAIIWRYNIALLYGLRVHQFELEMQNEELRRAQVALETSRAHYLELYDFAPVGYLTLTAEGIITEINLTGANLLAVERNKVINRRFAQFIDKVYQDRWHRHFVQAKQAAENTVMKAPSPTMTVGLIPHLDCLRKRESWGSCPS